MMQQTPTPTRVLNSKTFKRSTDEMGRINIPHVFRKTLGIRPGDELAVTRRGQVIEVRVAGATDCTACRGTGSAHEVTPT